MPEGRPGLIQWSNKHEGDESVHAVYIGDVHSDVD